MTLTEAKNAILLQAGFFFTEERPGLLGRLRPYQGLDESDFAEIAESIIVLHLNLTKSQVIEKNIVGALWWICDRARILVLNAGSSVRHNNLASNDEIELFAAWIDVIESMSNRMLQSNELPICIYRLLEYISGDKCVNASNFNRLAEYIHRCVSYDDPDVVDAARGALAAIASYQ
jgi:hypothetical protein